MTLEVLEYLHKNPDGFDLVITDMIMPHMTGSKLAIELNKICPDLPVLLCTGFSESILEEKGMAPGIGGFLLKPFLEKDLFVKIRDILV